MKHTKLIITYPNKAKQIVQVRDGFAGDFHGLAEHIARPYYPDLKTPIKYELK